jgi:lipopolysaccharide transport system ATP-binding protein
VDEVLAVGDAEFQKKAVGKMQDVSKGEGRTVLFVSHNIGMIQRLCTKGLLIQNGLICKNDAINIVIDEYQKTIDVPVSFINEKETSVISSIICNTNESDFSNKLDNFIRIKITINFENVSLPFSLGIAIKDSLGNKIFTVMNKVKHPTNCIICEIPGKILVPGIYLIDVAIFKGKVEIIEYLRDVCSFTLTDIGTEFSEFEGADYGKIFMKANWYV